MKRDMDLARRILLEVEAFPGPIIHPNNQIVIDGHAAEEIIYHVMLLHEAGLLDAYNLSNRRGMNWKPKRLTWLGHEFLDASREPSRWEKAKSVVLEKTGGLSFEALKQVLFQ
jgi:Hypothetical protein (DUF2513)